MAHIPYLRTSPSYTIVALCNSSIAAGESAIKTHSLPPSTKTYDSAEKLAEDPDVDMVLCSVNVVDHFKLIKPALERGKIAFVEWPLGRDLAEVESMVEMGKKGGAQTIVGLQGRQSLFVGKIRELVQTGRVGKVLSSGVMAEVGSVGKQVPLKYRYFVDKEVGGNMASIFFGHFSDIFTDVLGEFKDFNALLSTQHPLVDVVAGPPGGPQKTVETDVKKDTPDNIMVHGTLVSGAVASISMRGGRSFKDTPAIVWKIEGEKGQIIITAPAIALSFGHAGAEIKVYDLASDSVEVVELPEDDKADLPFMARNPARALEAFARGEKVPDFEDALVRHRLLDALYRSSETGEKVTYL